MTTDLKKLVEVTQTPRTDALVQITEGGAQIFDRLWMLNHARTLERECTTLQQEVETLRAKYEQRGLYLQDCEARVASIRQETLEEAAKVFDAMAKETREHYQSVKVGEGQSKCDWYTPAWELAAAAIRALQHTDGETKP